MKKKSVTLYYMTAGWLLLGAIIGGHFLFTSMKPTADVKAKYRTNVHRIWIGELEPGDVTILHVDQKPIVVWHRDLEEIATAMAQLEPKIPREEWSTALTDGTLALEIGADAYTRLEWFISSAVNVDGIGCIVLSKAGDYEGFFDPCQGTHFDLWGRSVKGPMPQSLKVTPAQFSDDRLTVLLDLTEMPKTR